MYTREVFMVSRWSCRYFYTETIRESMAPSVKIVTEYSSAINQIEAQVGPRERPHLLDLDAKCLRYPVLQDRDPILEMMIELDNRQRVSPSAIHPKMRRRWIM